MENKRKNFKWTDEKINILKEVYPTNDWNILIDKLGTNDKMIIMSKASSLKIKAEKYFYTEEEVNFLKNNYMDMSCKELSLNLGKTISSVKEKMNKLRLVKVEKWSEDELVLLENVYPHYPNRYLSEKFFVNRASYSIRRMALKLGYHKTKEKGMKRFNSDDMLERLKNLSIKLGRTPLYNELVGYGLPSPKSYERYFGGYINACELLDLEINCSIFGLNNGCYSINNDFCYSKSEKVVTDFFINNNVKYIKEDYYRNYINDNRCNTKRVDWVIGDNVFVEFFGLPKNKKYYEKMEIKRSICNDNNVVLTELFEKDLTKLHNIFGQYL